MQLRQVTIIGVGLLGGSLGLALRRIAPSCRIIGCGHRSRTLVRAAEMGAIDIGEADPARAVQGSDLVVLCTPVGLFEEILTQIAPALSRGTIVTDVGSTKRSIVRLAEQLLPSTVKFVASHPIAGSEKRGVEFARPELFRNALCIVTPSETTDLIALREVEDFWKSLGMWIRTMSPHQHDRLLSDVSHLPHLVAAALVAMQGDAALELCGKGFLDATRIASGDGALWRDILLDNTDNLREGLASLREQLDRAMAFLDQRDGAALSEWLTYAAKRRDATLEKRDASNEPRDSKSDRDGQNAPNSSDESAPQ